MLSLYFNDVIIPSWIMVNDITEEILPFITADKYQSKLGAKRIIVSFSFRRNKLITEDKRQEFVKWLKGDNFNLGKLILPGRIDYYYMAKVSNLSDISGSIRKGSGIIEFTCYDGMYIVNNEHVIDITDKSTYEVLYCGSLHTYPDITFNITSACNKIKLNFSNLHESTYIELNGSFNASNVIQVIQSKNKVLVNGNVNMPIWHLNSKRSKLQSGINNYKLESGNCTVKIKYNESYL